MLERLVEGETFLYLDGHMVEELAHVSGEGGAIFLRETHIEKMLMIPVRYQMELVGILALHTPHLNRTFRPEELGALLAISGQASSAIRNAQPFGGLQQPYAQLTPLTHINTHFHSTISHS